MISNHFLLVVAKKKNPINKSVKAVHTELNEFILCPQTNYITTNSTKMNETQHRMNSNDNFPQCVHIHVSEHSVAFLCVVG